MRAVLVIVPLLVMGLLSCNKNDDNSPPEIVIAAPLENQQIQAGSSFEIRASLRDDRMLEYVTFSLTDQNYIPVMKSVTLYPGSSSYELIYDYVPDDLQLPGGKYFIMVKAFDGTNTTHKYREVQLGTSPKKLNFIIAVTKSGSQTGLLRTDSLLSPFQAIITLESDFSGAGSDDMNHIFYLSGRYKGSLYAFNTSDFSLRWEKPAIVSPPFPYYTFSQPAPPRIYTGFYDGHYEVYNADGLTLQSRVIPGGMYPLKVYYHDPYIIIEQKEKQGSQRSMNVYFDDSFYLAFSENTDYEINSWIRAGENSFYILANRQGQGHLYIFEFDQMGSWEPHSLDAGLVCAAETAPDGALLIASESGISRYVYATNSLLEVCPGIAARSIKTNAVTGTFYVLSGASTLSEYAYPSGNLLRTVVSADSILEIVPVYNKP